VKGLHQIDVLLIGIGTDVHECDSSSIFTSDTARP
jgi:hypothetical protein